MIQLKKKPAKEPAINTAKEIVEVPVSSIKLWADNPRRNDNAVPKLAEVIKSRGQITPLVVWRKNNVIYKGNTTYKAMKSLGYKTVKVLFADFPSEQAAVAYGIADNKSSEFAEWDPELLSNMLEDEQITDTGFDKVELDFLIGKGRHDEIKAVEAKDAALKSKIVVMICDASSREEIVEMLERWIAVNKIKSIEVKK